MTDYRDDEDEDTNDSSDDTDDSVALASNDGPSGGGEALSAGDGGSPELTDDQRQALYDNVRSKFDQPLKRPDASPASYAQAADRTQVNQAIDNSNSMANTALWGRALDSLVRARGVARGGQGVDNQFWSGLAQQGQRGVQQAEASRQASINNYLTQNAIQRQVAQDVMAKGTYDEKMKALAWANDQHDPKSPSSAVARSSAAKLGYDMPDTASASDVAMYIMKPAEIQAQGDIKKELANTRGSYLASHQADVARDAAEKLATKRDEILDKDERLFSEALNSEKGRAGNYGKNMQRVQASDRINAMINSVKDPNQLSATQVGEIARDFDAMQGSGSGGSVETFKQILPQSAQGDASKFMAYIKGGPQPANMGDFVNNLKESVARQRDVALGAAHKTEDAISEGYDRLRKERPDRYKQILNASVSRAMSADNTPNISSGPTPADQQALNWAQDNPDDPRAATIISHLNQGVGASQMAGGMGTKNGRQ